MVNDYAGLRSLRLLQLRTIFFSYLFLVKYTPNLSNMLFFQGNSMCETFKYICSQLPYKGYFVDKPNNVLIFLFQAPFFLSESEK